MTFTEPIAPVHPITRTHHNISFIDNYEWLRDKESAETTAYLEAENAYTTAPKIGRASCRERV